MKHIFIINPKAGGKDSTNSIKNALMQLENKIDYEIYQTKEVYDACEFVKKCCEETNEELRFYACGGDGTLNEVVNGAYGYENVSITNYPCGSGNDFIKNFGSKDDFLNLENLIEGEEIKIDVLDVNGRLAINICNLGFDATVSENFVKFRKKPFIKGHGAYTLAVFYSLLFKMKYKCKVYVDSEKVHDDYLLLSALANGKCYGGGYYCAPLAKTNDGLIDVCVVKRVSRLKFIKMIGKYKKGLHLEDPVVKKYIKYMQGKNIKVTAEQEITYTIDGENFRSKEINVKIKEKAVKFIIPKNQHLTSLNK